MSDVLEQMSTQNNISCDVSPLLSLQIMWTLLKMTETAQNVWHESSSLSDKALGICQNLFSLTLTLLTVGDCRCAQEQFIKGSGKILWPLTDKVKHYVILIGNCCEWEKSAQVWSRKKQSSVRKCIWQKLEGLARWLTLKSADLAGCRGRYLLHKLLRFLPVLAQIKHKTQCVTTKMLRNWTVTWQYASTIREWRTIHLIFTCPSWYRQCPRAFLNWHRLTLNL